MASASELAIIIKAQNETTAVLKAIQRDLQQTEQKANSFGASLKRINETAAGFIQAQVITRGLSKIRDLFSSSITVASNYNESLSKTRVVFGDLSGEIEQFASSSARALGLSKQATLEAVSTFGNLFTAMRIGRPQAAQMSKSIVSLAADLASFNNLDPTEVLTKLRAGLVGETEPLRTLGVNLTAATIEARAFQLGIAKQGETLNAAQKAQAAYSIILEQTKTAQGDFARTAEGTANKNRILQASFADLKNVLGQELEPTYNRVLSGLIAKVQDPAFQQGVRDWAKSIRDFGADVEAGFGKTVIPTFEWIINNEGRLTAAIVAIGLAFAWTNPVAAGIGAIALGLNRIGQGQNPVTGSKNLSQQALEKFIIEKSKKDPAYVLGLDPKFLQGLDPEFIRKFDPSYFPQGYGPQVPKPPANVPPILPPEFPPVVKDATEALKSFREAMGNAIQSFISLTGVTSAASALFGRPTREQADLQLRQAEQNAFKAKFGDKAVHFGPGEGPGTDAKIDKQLKVIETEHDVLQKRITAANTLLITEKELNAEAGNLRDLMAAQSGLIKDKLNPTVNDLYPELRTAYSAFVVLNGQLSGPQSVVEGLKTFARELSMFKLPEFKDPNGGGAAPVPGFEGAR